MRRLGSLAFFILFLPLLINANPRPNIIFILVDDMGYGDLGCYGQKHIKTPNLDQMARNGMLFRNFYSGSTVCAPSRCSLMTGKHTGNSYIRGNGYPGGDDIPMRKEEVTIPEVLKTAGYRTALFGKWGLGKDGTEGSPEVQGFDEFYGVLGQVAAHYQRPANLWQLKEGKIREVALSPGTYANDAFTEKALEFIRSKPSDPFFIYLSLTVPHAELFLPDQHLRPYLTTEGRSIFEPEKAWPDGQHYGPQPFPKAAYAGMVSSIDHYVGQVLRQLEQANLEENTIVMFATDNGTHIEGGRTLEDVEFFKSSGPFKGTKRDMYEGGIRTPFIVQWKGKIKPGTTSDHIGAFWDILPTLAEAGGAVIPRDINGISFLPTLLNKKKQSQHDYLYWEFYERGFDQAVRKGKWKAVKLSRNESKLELYNLETDPGETKDVAAQYPSIRDEMETIIEKAHVKSDIFPLKKRD